MDEKTWELLMLKINNIEHDVKELLEFKWKIMGGAFVLGIVGSFFFEMVKGVM